MVGKRPPVGVSSQLISIVSGYTCAEVFESYKREAAILPDDERQIMVLMARFSFMPRLNCVARSLPSSISTDPLRQNLCYC